HYTRSCPDRLPLEVERELRILSEKIIAIVYNRAVWLDHLKCRRSHTLIGCIILYCTIPSVPYQEKDVEEGCGEKEEEEEEEEDQDDLQSAEKEEEVITKPGLEDDADIESPPENPQHLQQYCGVSVQDSLPRTRSLPAWDGLPSHTSIQPGDSIATTDTLQRDAHDLSPPPPIPCLDQVEMQFRASPIINNVVCRGEVGMRQGVSEEQGMNGGFDDGLPMKSEGLGMSPVDWTVSDVASYFAAVGFPEQAVAFKAQEIDGKSLLLMQRNDVLTGLSIRLGPAVKIYERHVKALQKTHFEDDDC
uniref:SAM domain-containing protein n=1 Tax=Gadus morhua TaxID=8049 RepID=A0A8C5FPR0_GADMO